MVALSDRTSFFYFNKAFLALLSVSAISQHHKGFFPPLSEYLQCFGDKTACGSLAGTGALLVKQLGKALARALGVLRGVCYSDKPNTWITKPSNKPLLMAGKMMSSVTFGPADRVGRVRRESEMLKG